MRVSDVMMGKSFLANLTQMKNNIDKVNREIYSGSKINKTSDSPTGTSKLIKLNESISQSESFQKNVAYSLSFMNETVSSMEEIEGEVGNKKVYDPRAYLKKAEEGIKERVKEAVRNLHGEGTTLFK